MSGEVVDPRFAVFTTRPRAISVREVRTTQYGPSGGVSQDNLEFQVSGVGEGWIDLAQSYFTIEGGAAQRIDLGGLSAPYVFPPGSNTGSPVTPISPACIGATNETAQTHLLWKDVRLYLNGVDVTDDTNQQYGPQSFYRKALYENSSYARGGGLTLAVVGAGGGVPAPIGARVPSGSLRVGRVDLSTGAGADADFIIPSGPTSEDVDPALLTDENYSDYTTDFARSAKRSGIAGSSVEVNAVRATRGMRFQPEIGMWQQGKLLPPNTELRIVLSKGAPALAYHRDVPASVGVEEPGDLYDPNRADSLVPIAFDWNGDLLKYPMQGPRPNIQLNLVRVFPTDSMKAALASALLARPAGYNIVRSRVQQIPIPRGSTSIDKVGLFAGVRPETVVVSFPATKALQGAYPMSPFYTSDKLVSNPGHGLLGIINEADPLNPKTTGRLSPVVTEIFVTWGAQQTPLRPYGMVTEEERRRAYTEGYLRGSTSGSLGEAPMLSYADWSTNFTCFVFSLNPDQSPAGLLAPPLEDVGSMELHVRFDNTQPSDVDNTILIVGFTGALVEIAANRAVSRIGF